MAEYEGDWWEQEDEEDEYLPASAGQGGPFADPLPTVADLMGERGYTPLAGGGYSYTSPVTAEPDSGDVEGDDLFSSFMGQPDEAADQPPTIGGGSFDDLYGAANEAALDGSTGDVYGSPDIDELRAAPWSTEFEQAAIARADELSSQRYNSLRQQRADEMARQGIGPDSPFWQSEMRKIDTAQAQDSSSFRRQLQLESVGQRRENLREARSVELILDSLERQQIMDMLGLSGGGIDPNLASILGGQAGQAGAAASDAYGGLGELLAAYLSSQSPSIVLG